MKTRVVHRKSVFVVQAWIAAVLLMLACVGCITSPKESGVATRDGVQYGRTEGRFRGRWWNYYERGRSFADGRFWPEAEKDLRTALGSRGRDQLWPRTYGLHFTPEYFPHRELGIVLSQQGRLEEALRELEASMDQLPSARAAYYLDETRRQWVRAQSLDKAEPVIEIAGQQDAVEGSLHVQVKGVARDDTFIQHVLINGEAYPIPVSAPEVAFSRDLTLSPGDNTIRVTAVDLAGKTTTAETRLRADVDGPAISFDAPVTLPGRISGVAFDASGISSVTLAGQPAVLASGPEGIIAFAADLPREKLAPPLSYESADKLGNVTRGTIPLNTLVVSELDRTPVVFARSDAVRVSSIGHGLNALFVDGQLMAVAAAETPADAKQAVTAHFANLVEGQKYLMDEIVVGVDIDAEYPIKTVKLNGAGLQTIPGRTAQRLSRRVPLQPGANTFQAEAVDVRGQQGVTSVAVERKATKIEQPENKLSVAILGSVWKGNSPLLENEAALITDDLTRELSGLGRFTLVERSLLPEALAEQELSAALGSQDRRLALGKVISAEVMLIGRVRRDAGALEIVVECISTETSVILARADAAGPANDMDQLRGLIRDLGLRITQEFPRASGQVALFKAPKTIVTNLSTADRVRDSMKYVIMRMGDEILDPATKQSLGRDTDILGEAIVRSVDDKKSTAESIVKEEGAPPPAIQVGDQVVTK